MPTKDKDKKGPSTQSTSTSGVNAVGVNHGTKQVNYSPGFTDVAGSPSYQQYGGQQAVQQAPVVSQPQAVQQQGPQQVPAQTAANPQQNPVAQPTQAASAGNVVQPAPQQITLPNQITMPGGRVITVQPQQQPVQQTGAMPQQVTLGNNTYQMPQQTAPAPQQTPEKSTAQQNDEYERTKQYNQAVDDYLKSGGNPNAIRSHEDPNIERMQPTNEQLQQAQANAQRVAGDEDKFQKTLMERLDELSETPEKRAEREKREARQRRWAAISEGLANVFNVGGAIAGAQPAKWESGVGDLYADQEAESDKRRLEYRQALKDLVDYRTAIRNGDIALAKAIEDRRKNDIYEYRIMQEMEAKAQERQVKEERAQAEEKRKDQREADRHRKSDDDHEKHERQMNGTYSPSGKSKKSTNRKKGRGGGGSKKKGSGRTTEDKRRARIENDGTY